MSSEYAVLKAADEGSRRRWRALAVLAVGLVMSMTTWFASSAVIPQLREEWGLSDGAAAWLQIAVQIGFVVGALVSATFNLSDLISPRVVILAGTAGAATANAFLLAADGPGLAVPMRFLTGFCIAGVYPPAFKLMATWFRRGRGTALGVLAGAIAVGSGGPHLVNGLGGVDWRNVIVATSVLTVLGGLVSMAVTPGPFPFPRAVFDPRKIGLVFSNRGVRLASFGYFGHMWELFGMWGWFIAFTSDSIAEAGGDPVPAAAFVTFAMFAAGGAGSYVGGVLGDRWGRTRTTALMLAISGSCAVLIGTLYSGPLWAVVALGLVWGFTVIADSAQFSTMVTELADQAYVGTALTLQLAVGFTLTVVTIRLIPILEARFGWRWAFAVLALGPALGAAAMLRLKGLPEAERIAGGRG